MNLIQILEWDPVTCTGFEIPGKLAYLISLGIKLIQFGVPLLLIVFGMLDLGKAVVASKEDEIKKGQQMFIKRLIAAVLVFFVVTVVGIVINFASADGPKEDSENGTIMDCINEVIKYNSSSKKKDK